MAGGEAIAYLKQENLRYSERDRLRDHLPGSVAVGEVIVYLKQENLRYRERQTIFLALWLGVRPLCT